MKRKGLKKWLILVLATVAAASQAGVLPPVLAPVADAVLQEVGA